MRILVAEDDPSLTAAITFALKTLNHYVVECVRDGQAARAAIDAAQFDLLILDLGLPRLDGIEVLRALRAGHHSLPVLITSGRSSEEDKIRALDLGADDYIVKPFSVRELEARVRALLRRSAPAGPERSLLCQGGLCYDRSTGTASLNGTPLNLSVREVAVLELLLKDFGKVVRKEKLIAQIYSRDEAAGPNAIEVFVHRLRKKLSASPYTVKTFHGLGYQLARREPAQESLGDTSVLPAAG